MAKKNIRPKARFITVEGTEGSGKSSIIGFLYRYLRQQGHSVKVFREPGSTAVGEKIRTILLDKKNGTLSKHTELLLYLAARTQLIEEKLNMALRRYDIVICDRFFDSTLVYQGFALGLGSVARKAVKIFSLGVKPDLTLVLDGPVLAGLKRLKRKDRIESRSLGFHNKLRKGYLKLARQYPQRIAVVNARGELRDIYVRVQKVVQKRLGL